MKSLEILKKYVNDSEIICVTANEKKHSSDYDIYCVVKPEVPSSVHIFEEAGEWYELFIDNLNDVKIKLCNTDEIAINFLLEMPLIAGDKVVYEKLVALAHKQKENYCIPADRRNKIVYRIKVLSSKLFNPEKNETIEQASFLIAGMTYPLMQLILDTHHILPSSPKRWILQLEKSLSSDDYADIKKMLIGKADKELMRKLINKYAGHLDALHIDKSTSNQTTFIS